MKVEVQSRKFISPSTPTPNHLRDFKISSIDQLHGDYPQFVLYYLPGATENGLESCETRSKQLQKSLAGTLTLFYHFAGRYNPEKLIIECNDKGVEYTEAKVSGKQLCEVVNGEVETHLLNQFLSTNAGWHKTPSGDDLFNGNMIESFVSVQANMFDCGGLAIGLAISHMVGDAFTMSRFLDTWARISKYGNDQVDAPKFLLPALFPAGDLVEGITIPPIKRNVVMKNLVFDGAKIAGLKKDLATSKVKLVTALIWKTLIRLNQPKLGYLKPTRITNAINLRGKSKLPVEDSCGNFAACFPTDFVPDKHGNKVEIRDLVGLLDDSLSKTIRDYAELDCEGLRLKATNALKEKGEDDFIGCSSWCRFKFYEADFGWGNPDWISLEYFPVEMVVRLMDSTDGNGIEAWITLQENDMVQFLQDPDIVAFTATTTS